MGGGGERCPAGRCPRRVGEQGDGGLGLPEQGLHDTDVALTRDAAEHRGDVVAGGQLGVARHVPQGGPAQRPRQ